MDFKLGDRVVSTSGNSLLGLPYTGAHAGTIVGISDKVVYIKYDATKGFWRQPIYDWVRLGNVQPIINEIREE
jgi:hypothetical protein